MKRVILAFLVMFLCTTITVSAQKVTMNLQQAKLEKVLSTIAEQTGYTFAYSQPVVNTDRIVSIEVANSDLPQVLQKVFSGTNISYEIRDKKILLSEKKDVNQDPKTTQQTQKIAVKGIALDEAGEPLIGASVSEKGTTNGTMTGVDGDYSLTVPANATLVVTFVGYLSQEIPLNGQKTVDFTLKKDSKMLDEVVVTALGIKRDKKSLGYAMQEVKGDQLTETRDANVANALAGKVAGLQIKQSGTGVTGSSRIVLRGGNSIAGNNQPLVVVDGVPIDSSTGGTDDFWGNHSVDKGSSMADISPDDIESISVLKGPAAAALYGSRAGNGVIMITTKTGKNQKGIGISYNSNLTFERPMQLPKYQNTYGQGENGKYVQNSVGSWGAKMDGSQITDLAGNPTTYSSGDNDLMDFLRTGTTWTNSLDLSSSSDKNSIRVGVMNLRNKGVVPNSSFNKTSATLRATADLTDKLSFDAKITYYTQKTENRIKLAGDPDNIFRNYLLMPRSVHFSDLNRYPDYKFPENTKNPANGADLSGKPVSWTDQYSGLIRNPYWAAYKDTNSDRRDRVLGFGSLKYEFTDWLNIQARYGIDYFSTQYEMRDATGLPYWFAQGQYIMNKETSYEANADVLLTFNKQLSEKVGLLATAGGNLMYRRADGIYGETGPMIIPDFHTLANAGKSSARSALTKKAINSLYATASLSYDNTLYLDVTARNDWSSALSADNRSYFYPSVGTSWLFSESLSKWNVKPSFLDFGKLRLSWAEVGNDTDPYRLLDYLTLGTTYVYNPETDQVETILNGKKSNILNNPDLKNETITSWEAGLELRAFNNRLGLDFAYYTKDATDQILKMNVPASTGYSFKYVNAGKLRNNGVEILLTGTPVKTKDFSWDITLNYSKNKSKIIELADGIETQELQDPSLGSLGIKIVAAAGGTYGDIYGKAYARNDKGELIINENGLPTFGSDFVKLGNYNPDWMGGISNAFHYRNFDFSFQIDGRFGGDVFMGSIQSGTGAGTLKMTESGRDKMVVAGVTASGQVNAIETTAEKYWAQLATGTEPWIYDATNIRLREMSLGYSFPRKMLSKTPFQKIKLSLVGRNLWMIYSKTKGFDPESGYSTSNAQGIEFGSMPTMSSYGFNLNVTF